MSRLSLSDCVPVALGGKDVMVTKVLIEDVSALLMLIEGCRGAKQTNKNALDCNCN